MEQCCSLSYKQRIYGCFLCIVGGWIISFLSTLLLTHPPKFAILYTVGNIVSICGTFFLWGPCKQIRKMANPHRLGATLVIIFFWHCVYMYAKFNYSEVYLAAMGLTLYLAFAHKQALWILVAVVFQSAALFWYTLSFIPYAR